MEHPQTALCDDLEEYCRDRRRLRPGHRAGDEFPAPAAVRTETRPRSYAQTRRIADDHVDRRGLRRPRRRGEGHRRGRTPPGRHDARHPPGTAGAGMRRGAAGGGAARTRVASSTTTGAGAVSEVISTRSRPSPGLSAATSTNYVSACRGSRRTAFENETPAPSGRPTPGPVPWSGRRIGGSPAAVTRSATPRAASDPWLTTRTV